MTEKLDEELQRKLNLIDESKFRDDARQSPIYEVKFCFQCGSSNIKVIKKQPKCGMSRIFFCYECGMGFPYAGISLWRLKEYLTLIEV